MAVFAKSWHYMAGMKKVWYKVLGKNEKKLKTIGSGIKKRKKNIRNDPRRRWERRQGKGARTWEVG